MDRHAHRPRRDPNVVALIGGARSRFAMVLGLSFVVAGCGRTAEPVVPCAALVDDCDGLLEQQASLEAIYAASDPSVAADAQARLEAGQCLQLVEDALLDGDCVEVCPELCRLHPCGILDAEGVRQAPSTCADRCTDLVDAGTVAADDLSIAIEKAAEDPGFCTCRACTSPDDALCTQLFDCAVDGA